MKALVFHGIGNVKLKNVPEPVLLEDKDAIIRITASSICGTDLHMVRGTMSGMKNGTILGHEAVGIVECIGPAVQKFKVGDRVVVCSTIACGECVFCDIEEFASCEQANPIGPDAGTAFFGGPTGSGSFNGLQAEKARIPFADTTLVKLPDSISDEDGLLLSDIFPTGFMGAEMADVQAGDAVAVFGCGPVGQMAIASAKLFGASKIFAIDCLQDRLDMAELQGAIPINYEKVDPVKKLKELTGGFGPDSCIDAVGIDAQAAHHGPASMKNLLFGGIQHMVEQKLVAPFSVLIGDKWRQGDAPFQALTWCVEAVRKSGAVSIIGVYPESAVLFPIGAVMQKTITVKAANCSHRRFIPKLIQVVQNGFSPSTILTKLEEFKDVVSCYENFDQRKPGWMKVELIPPTEEAA